MRITPIKKSCVAAFILTAMSLKQEKEENNSNFEKRENYGRLKDNKKKRTGSNI